MMPQCKMAGRGSGLCETTGSMLVPRREEAVLMSVLKNGGRKRSGYTRLVVYLLGFIAVHSMSLSWHI